MKKITILYFILIFIPFGNVQAFAQTITQAIPTASTGLRTQLAQDTRVTNLIARADTEITRRITALNDVKLKLGDVKCITDAQKTSFSSQIDTEVTNLTSLKTKIDADTDITTLKTDVQSIVVSYRVFLLFIPQIRMVVSSDKIINITETLNDFATILASRITQVQNAGKDVTNLQTLLSDMQSKTADAKTQATNAISIVIPLIPSGYPDNKSSLLSARTALQTAHQDVVSALQDGKKIIQGLKELKSTVITPTLAPSITSTPTI